MMWKGFVKLILTIFVALFGLTLFILPLAWIFIAAFQVKPGMGLGLEPLTLSNFYSILAERVDIPMSLINSLIIAGISTILTTVVGSLAAYGFSRSKFPHADALLFPILLFSTLPLAIIIVPIYSESLLFNIQDTMLAVILFMAALSTPFTIILLKGFVDEIPTDYEDAAMVDGASQVKAFFAIDLPLMKNGIFVVSLLSFAGAWGNFFLPLILIMSEEKLPAACKLFTLYSQYGGVDLGQVAAFAIIYAMPLLVIYFFLGKYLGTTVASGIKG